MNRRFIDDFQPLSSSFLVDGEGGIRGSDMCAPLLGQCSMRSTFRPQPHLAAARRGIEQAHALQARATLAFAAVGHHNV